MKNFFSSLFNWALSSLFFLLRIILFFIIAAAINESLPPLRLLEYNLPLIIALLELYYQLYRFKKVHIQSLSHQIEELQHQIDSLKVQLYRTGVLPLTPAVKRLIAEGKQEHRFPITDDEKGYSEDFSTTENRTVSERIPKPTDKIEYSEGSEHIEGEPLLYSDRSAHLEHTERIEAEKVEQVGRTDEKSVAIGENFGRGVSSDTSGFSSQAPDSAEGTDSIVRDFISSEETGSIVGSFTESASVGEDSLEAAGKSSSIGEDSLEAAVDSVSKSGFSSGGGGKLSGGSETSTVGESAVDFSDKSESFSKIVAIGESSGSPELGSSESELSEGGFFGSSGLGSSVGGSGVDGGEGLGRWELFVGKKVLNIVGIALFTLGVVWGLLHALAQFPPIGRVIIGGVGALVLFIFGRKLEGREELKLFGRILAGGAWAIAYFLAYGIYYISALKLTDSPIVGMTALAAVGGGFLLYTLSYRSQAMAAVGLLLAYTTLFISPVSLYTHVATVVIAVLVGFLSYRFHWFWIQFFGILFLYGGYGAWLIYGEPVLTISPEFERGVLTGIIGIFFLSFELPTLLRNRIGKADISEKLEVWSSIFNILLLSVVYGVKVKIYGSSGVIEVLLAGSIFYFISGELILYPRKRRYLFNCYATLSLVLGLIFFWRFFVVSQWKFISWLLLGFVWLGYSLLRSELYLRALGGIVVSLSIWAVLGSSLLLEYLDRIYSLVTGLTLVGEGSRIFSSIQFPGAGWSGGFSIVGIILAGVIFSVLWRLELSEELGNRERCEAKTVEYSVLFGLTPAFIAGSWMAFSEQWAAVLWLAWAVILNLYGWIRKSPSLRLFSYGTAFSCAVAVFWLPLSPYQISAIIGVTGVILYLDLILDLIFFQNFSKKKLRASGNFYRIFFLLIIISVFISVYSIFSPVLFYGVLSWILFSVLIFYWSFWFGGDFERFISHGVLFLAIFWSVFGLVRGYGPILDFGEWSASAFTLLLLLSAVISQVEGYFFSRGWGKRRGEEESVVVSVGHLGLAAALWWGLPSLSLAPVFALLGVLFWELAGLLGRRYLGIHSMVAMFFSIFWFFSTSLGGLSLEDRFFPSLFYLAPIFMWFYFDLVIGAEFGGIWGDRSLFVKRLNRWFSVILSVSIFLGFFSFLYFKFYWGGESWALLGLGAIYLGVRIERKSYLFLGVFSLYASAFSAGTLAVKRHLSPVEWWAYLLDNPAIIAILATLLVVQRVSRTLLRGLYKGLVRAIDFSVVLSFSVVPTLFVRPPHYSIVWGIVGLFLAFYGLSVKIRLFRISALVLFGAIVLKLLAWDIFSFSLFLRIITFIAVGLSLLTVSFLYNRLKEGLSAFISSEDTDKTG